MQILRESKIREIVSFIYLFIYLFIIYLLFIIYYLFIYLLFIYFLLLITYYLFIYLLFIIYLFIYLLLIIYLFVIYLFIILSYVNRKSSIKFRNSYFMLNMLTFIQIRPQGQKIKDIKNILVILHAVIFFSYQDDYFPFL